MKLFIYLFVVTILFLIYIECSVGNVIYRVTSDGSKTILLKNIIYYLIEPFKNGYLWKLSVLDLNYIFVIVLSLIIYHNINLMNLYYRLNNHHHRDL